MNHGKAVMKALAALFVMLAMPGLAFAAVDDYKVIKLEQDVRRLEQQVRELSRQLAELRREPADQIQTPANRTPAASASSPLWLQMKQWQALQVGMNELQVIETLGPPTSTRIAPDGDARILFYSLELAANSFLSGSVEMRDRRLVEIKIPELK
jgi:hypothetical protein